MNYLDGYVLPLALKESSRARGVEERWFVNFLCFWLYCHNFKEN